jgi:DamX protein
MTDSPDPNERDRNQGDDPDLAGFLHSEYPRRPTEPDPTDSLRRPPPPPGDPGDTSTAPEAGGNMRDMEKSLVDRIADVDDDRRRTAIQLRKALETHRDEIRAQRRRDHNALLALSGIGIILLAAVLLLFSQLLQTRDALDARLSQLESSATASAAGADPGEGPATSNQQADTASEPPVEEVDELADAIEAIGDRLTALEGRLQRLSENQAAAGAGTDGTAAVGSGDRAAEIGAAETRLEQKLAALGSEVNDLRGRLDRDAQAATRAAAQSSGAGADANAAGPSLTTEVRTIALQLAGFPSRSAIDRFIARHDLPKQVYLRVDTWRGGSWYGLVHSLHPDMASAEAARADLPPDLARLDLWLRELPPGSRLQVLAGQP